MSEQQQYEGEKWTKGTISILSQLGWKQLGTSGVDIPCVNTVKHATNPGPGKRRKNPHGVDSFFSYYDPYLCGENAVIVESKKRIWTGITKASIQEFINQLFTTLECGTVSEELNNYEHDFLDTGLLMIWCNEVDKFNDEDFRKYLSQLEIPTKKKNYKLYIASNTEILRFCSLIRYIDLLKSRNNCTEFDYFYPSDNFSSKPSVSIRQQTLNLTHMFSNYIFGKSKHYMEFHDGDRKSYEINHVFLFSEPTLEELYFVDSLIKKYQLEDSYELHIHLYGDQSKYRGSIDYFTRTKNLDYQKSNNSEHEKMKIKYMDILKDVPASFGTEV